MFYVNGILHGLLKISLLPCKICKRVSPVNKAIGIAFAIATRRCRLHRLRQTAMTAMFWYRVSIARDTLLNTHSIARETAVLIANNRSKLLNFSSFTYMNWYKYTNPFTDTIAADSYNMLMIAISAISLSRRGVRKLPQGADLLFHNIWQMWSIKTIVLRSMTSAAPWIIPSKAMACKLPRSACKTRRKTAPPQ